jgi:uncharacterized membrane protein YebE (DUF533 family)
LGAGQKIRFREEAHMPLGFAQTLFANQVRASTGKAGIVGIAAGLAFNMLLRRSPVGAVLVGGAMIAYQAYQAGEAAKARRAAKSALEKGASQPQHDVISVHPAT